MPKIISFMHLSLDGFVGGPKGEMNWIKMDEEIFEHVSKRIGQTDTALYGRVTYQMMENYWPDMENRPDASKLDKRHASWYKKSRKLVLSKTLKDTGLTNTHIISDQLYDRIQKIRQQDGPEILLFGSPTATHALQQLNLIDGYWLFVNPIILGEGLPLFVDIKDKVKLKKLSDSSFTNGVTELSYWVEPSA